VTALVDVDSVIGDYSGLSRTVLDYAIELKRIVDSAKEPGFDEGGWDPLARFISTDSFMRVGPFKDKMSWQEYVAFLTAWATNMYWECSFRRVTEAGSLVFLELEERSEPGNSRDAVNSLSSYEFDDAGRLTRLNVYLQMAMPAGPPPGQQQLS
jgi:hypothetical protein